LVVSVMALPVPPAARPPSRSSAYFFVAAMTLRAELFTEPGSCPSAQLMEESAEAFVLAVFDHA